MDDDQCFSHKALEPENQCGYDRPARSYALLRIRRAALIPQPSALLQGFPFHGLLSATVLRDTRPDYSTRILRPRLLGSALRYIRGFNSKPLWAKSHELSPSGWLAWQVCSQPSKVIASPHADFQSWLVMVYYQSTRAPHP